MVAFDLDGTIIREPSSWVKLHKFFGTMERADLNLLAYERGEIDYEEFMRRDVALWQPPPHITTVERVLFDYTLSPNADYTVKILRSMGCETAIISSGIDMLACKVADTLGISYVLANSLIFDSEGFLTGDVVFRVDLGHKDRNLKALADRLGIELAECIVVGDSKFDRSFLFCAGLGVAYDPDEELIRVADVVIYDLKELLNYI